MRRRGLFVPPCLVSCGILAAAASAADVSALQIREKSYDPATRQLVYELWNASDRVVTAWRLSLARGDGHGHAQRSVLDQDFALVPRWEAEGLSSPAVGGGREGPIAPGESHRAVWQLEIGDEDSGPAALSLAVTAAVFEDLSHEGDRQAAAAIVEARAARVEEIAELLGSLENERRMGRSRQEWVAKLRQLAQARSRASRAAAIGEEARREVAAQLSASRLELAEWLEAAVDEVALSVDLEVVLDRLTSALREQVEGGLASIPHPEPEDLQ